MKVMILITLREGVEIETLVCLDVCFVYSQIMNVIVITIGTRQHKMFPVCAILIRRGVVM